MQGEWRHEQWSIDALFAVRVAANVGCEPPRFHRAMVRANFKSLCMPVMALLGLALLSWAAEIPRERSLDSCRLASRWSTAVWLLSIGWRPAGHWPPNSCLSTGEQLAADARRLRSPSQWHPLKRLRAKGNPFGLKLYRSPGGEVRYDRSSASCSAPPCGTCRRLREGSLGRLECEVLAEPPVELVEECGVYALDPVKHSGSVLVQAVDPFEPQPVRLDSEP